MKFIHQSDQSIADALCAIILLENTSVEQAIRAFFDMRRQALDDLISSFDKDTTEYVEFLGEIGGLIHMTVRQAWSVFGAQEGGKSLLEESLSRLHDPSVGSRRASTAPRPTGSGPEDMQSVWLSGLFSERTNIHVMVRHLPPGLRSQTIAIPNYSISVREAGEEALTWIRDITDAAKTGVASILGKISSGQRLWTIREKVVMEMAKEESQGSKSRSHLLASSGDDNNGLHTNTSHLPWSEVC